MANVKEYKQKIKSLVNTRKITKTMKMVAASKLRKAYEAQAHAKQYERDLSELVARLSASVNHELHPLFIERKANGKALVLVFTSDSGLCGAFNHNVNNRVAVWIEEKKDTYEKIDLSFCGRKGHSFFASRASVRNFYKDVAARPSFKSARMIGEDLAGAFLSGKYDEVYLAYNQFLSPLSQKVHIRKVLPIDPKALDAGRDAAKPADYIFEPDALHLLEFLMPHFLYFEIYFALLENSAGEHGARMTAMDNATKNANELITRYTLLRNRARQAQITIELTEITAGAEALQ